MKLGKKDYKLMLRYFSNVESVLFLKSEVKISNFRFTNKIITSTPMPWESAVLEKRLDSYPKHGIIDPITDLA